MFAREELSVFTGLSCESIGTSAVYTLHLQFIEFVKSSRSIWSSWYSGHIVQCTDGH